MNRIGGPITLFVIGAIPYFAVATSVPGVNLGMVGLILVVGGGIWLLMGMLTGTMKSTATTQTRIVA